MRSTAMAVALLHLLAAISCKKALELPIPIPQTLTRYVLGPHPVCKRVHEKILLDTTSVGNFVDDAKFAQFAHDVMESLVLIEAQNREGAPKARFAGTGVVIDAQGSIITNRHVIEFAKSITVTPISLNAAGNLLLSGPTVEATLLAEVDQHDVALLRVRPGSPFKRSIALLTTSEDTFVGQLVWNFGRNTTCALGVITEINNVPPTTLANGPGASQTPVQGLIKVTIHGEEGDSGGPLVDAKKRVIGLMTAGRTPNMYVMPIEIAKRALDARLRLRR